MPTCKKTTDQSVSSLFNTVAKQDEEAGNRLETTDRDLACAKASQVEDKSMENSQQSEASVECKTRAPSDEMQIVSKSADLNTMQAPSQIAYTFNLSDGDVQMECFDAGSSDQDRYQNAQQLINEQSRTVSE